MDFKREYGIGVTAGFSLTVPLLGRILPIPASALALIFPLVAFALLLSLPRERHRLTGATICLLGLIGLYVALVLQSAAGEQFLFFLTPSNWLTNAEHYYDAKLLKFILALAPGLVATLCFSFVRQSEVAFRGLEAAIVLVALLATANVLQHSDILIRTSFDTAARYFRNPYDMGHSVVSYGILFCLGTAAAMTMRRMWMLSALFIFMLFLIGRRAELVISVASLLAFSVWHFFDGQASLRKMEVWRFAPVMLIAASLISLLHNDVAIARWGMLAQSAEQRMEIISTGMSASLEAQAASNIDTPTAEAQTATPAAQPDGIQQKQAAPTRPLLWGNGLGWYATLGEKHVYPHNLVVETYLESGAITAICVLMFLALCVYLPSRTKWTPHSLAFLVMFGSLTVISLKAGDISFGARVIGFAVMAGTFRWPLLDNLIRERFSSREASAPLSD